MKIINSKREAYEGQFFVQDISAIPRESDDYFEKKRNAFKSHKDVGKIVAFKDEPWSSAYEVIGSDGDLYEVKKIGSPSGQIGVVRTHWEDIGFADDVVKRYTNNFSLDNGEFESTKPYLSNAIIHILKQHYKNVVKDLTKKPNIFRFSDKIINESLNTKMKFKLLESTYYADKDYLIEKNKKTKHQRRIERAKKGSAIVNSKVHNPLTCPQCMAQLKGEVNDKQPAQNESFEYNLEPDNACGYVAVPIDSNRKTNRSEIPLYSKSSVENFIRDNGLTLRK